MRFVPVPLLASAMVVLQELSTCPNITEIYVQTASDSSRFSTIIDGSRFFFFVFFAKKTQGGFA